MPKLTRINLGLSCQLLKRVDAFARAHGLDRTNALRMIITQSIDVYEAREKLRDKHPEILIDRQK